MHKIIVVAFALSLVVLSLVSATAQTATPQGNTYTDALRTCAAEWKASDQRKAVKKGEGMAAWQTFRAECTKRVGYTSKRRGQVGGENNG